MGMFDWYQPRKEIECPVCSVVLEEWQGKDGPNGLFVRREGEGAPVDQARDEGAKIQKKRGQPLDYQRSLKSILTIVSIIAFWLDAEPRRHLVDNKHRIREECLKVRVDPGTPIQPALD